MEDKEQLPEIPENGGSAASGDDGHGTHGSPHPNRVRRRIKVRKRVRIKKKPSSRKKFKKLGEKLFWIGLVIAFIVSLIIMIVQLDISDKKFKKQRKNKGSVTVETYDHLA
jgi:hypothetical protein